MKAIESAVWPPDILKYLSGVTSSTVRASLSCNDNKNGYVLVQSTDLQYCKPRPITSYKKLRELVSQLANYNPQYEIYFRGQTHVFGKGGAKDKPGHSLLPSMCRQPSLFNQKAHVLQKCDQYLLGKCLEKLKGGDNRAFYRLQENPLARWAILQHYGICETPLLDLTRTLQVACSFALSYRDTVFDPGYVYVLGLPFQREKIMAETSEGILSMSLLGITPSNARRPLVQDGFLACDRDWWRVLNPENDIPVDEKTSLPDLSSYDFCARILAVFKVFDGCVLDGINDDAPVDFWTGSSLGPLAEADLYPSDDDFAVSFLDTCGIREHAEKLRRETCHNTA